ncbi:SSU ribosomal protein S3P [Kushneria sinocarnis]|uniref:Small ribosomal subunit protein uS3 n=1 Tax=Kushneria sinocarnis TaxID=595502 RepID=A0A420WT03_9GAMM|nr:30S ribosomal protein S3 [Kushneria sinocarnis]RKQ95896.1 SSU ribosomal protein S3P [Kushneria sinocarnis]
MGQKVNPVGIRLGIVKDHTSVWYAEGDAYADKLNNDLEVRRFLSERLKNASVSRIQIERPANNARITIHTARPGIVIGKKGEDVDRLRRDLTQMMGVPVHVNIEEVRKPELDASLVAQNVAGQLERRVMFRRAMKRAVQNAMRLGAKGIRIQLSGRLGGAEIARTEWYREGRVPLHTLRADIDFSVHEAHTTYGVIGVKVWIFKGEILGGIEEVRARQKQSQQQQPAPKKKGSR